MKFDEKTARLRRRGAQKKSKGLYELNVTEALSKPTTREERLIWIF